MQSKKTAKKSPKTTEEAVIVPETNPVAELKAARPSRSAKNAEKKPETATPSKTHRKASPVSAPAVSPEPANPVKVMAAAAGAEIAAVDSPIIDPVGTLTVPTEEVARLAYSYWVARGYSHGSHEDDWIRAEQELIKR
jgi:hypothetical protein